MLEGRTLLLALAKKYGNDWKSIYNALQTKEVIEDFTPNIYKAITILDDDYPDYLKQINQPPFVIYYDGDICALQHKKLVALFGDNDFDFKPNDIVSLPTEWGKVYVGDKLKIWTNCSYMENIKLACSVAKNVAITQTIRRGSLLYSVVEYALCANSKLFVKPTNMKSPNNALIKEGAILLDCREDIYENN